MATYVPGVPSYLPTFTPFTPDFKFLSNVLDVKTQKYETNYKALNDLYSKVVYGDLSREDTKAMRDQFAENLGPRLQQISGMDLSVMQNAEAAKSIFRPFFEEDLIVKDLVTTKQYRNELSGAELLRNNPNQEMREQYWQTGVQKMQYEMEDFVNASEEDALRMAAPTYVPDADLYEMANAVLTESGLEAEISEISKDGLWIIKRKNGDLISREALQMVQKTLKDDPRVVNAYHAKAYVESRQFADEGVKSGKFTNINQGQTEWAKDKIKTIEAKIAESTKKLEKEEVEATNTSTSWEVFRKQHGIVKGSKEEKLAKESWSTVNAIKLQLDNNKNLLSESKSIDADNPEETTPENKQKLLYRAYGLMMNLNMESDLQAAALNYSNIGKKIDFEVNPYGKMRIQHKYDLNKIAIQNANALERIRQKGIEDRKTAEYEASLENPLAGSGVFDFLNVNVSNKDFNTDQAETDEDGNLDSDYDYQAKQQEDYIKRSSQINDEKIAASLEMLKAVKQEGNEGSGKFTIEGIGTGTLPELQKIMKTKSNDNENVFRYQNEIDAFYTKMEDLLKEAPADASSLANGEGSNLVLDQDGQALSNLRAKFKDIKTSSLAVDAAMSSVMSTMSNNLDLALETNLGDVDGVSDLDKIMKLHSDKGMPSIYYKDENGATQLYTKEEYAGALSEWAASDKNTGYTVEDTPMDDSWGYVDGRVNNDDDYGAIGYGKKRTERWVPGHWSSGTASGPTMGTGTSTWVEGHYANTIETDNSVPLEFDDKLARKQSEEIYGAMYALANYSANGGLETLVSPKTESGDDASYTKMFKSPDLEQLLRGMDPSLINPGDVTKAPTYEVVVDPLQLTQEGVDMLQQVHSVTMGDNSFETKVFLEDRPFNELQRGQNWQDSDEDMLSPGEEVNAANFSAGKVLLTQYFQDLKRMQAKGATKSDYPGATIKYYTSWTSDSDNLDHQYSGYTITFDEDYIDQYRKDGGILDGLTGDNDEIVNTLNIVIPKGNDQNPYKEGTLNFSSVATQIASSDDGAYSETVPLGGSINVIQDHKGMFEIAYDIEQFDAESGGWKNAVYRNPLTDQNGNPITVNDRRYLDYYVNEYVLALEKAAEQNKKDKKAWMTANPGMLVTDPIYQFN